MLLDHHNLNNYRFIFTIFVIVFQSLFCSWTMAQASSSFYRTDNDNYVIKPLRIVHTRMVPKSYIKTKRFINTEPENNLIDSDNQIDSNRKSQISKNQLAPPLDIRNLMNRYQLTSMKWLLSMPNNGQQQIDPNVLRQRIMSTRWSRVKNGQPFVLLNNQLVPVDLVTNSVINSNLNGVAPKQMLDLKLIAMINNGQNKKKMIHKLYGDENKRRDDYIYHPYYSNIEHNLLDHDFHSTNSVKNFAPNFKRFPNDSQRFRLSTLGRIGYDQQ
ncbi:hypothetical protein DERP_001126 [Dermatophagoides pteronyssinus]|uniref:Uncharacterized protein n=1 Tax=Dermatophagoides pteronyssinus TaxID=6956 RepID=A0ABQ8JDK0_DERPT|nr:hypothetical protein DERP_001126 [Dermatophagoides pteronyssinus]